MSVNCHPVNVPGRRHPERCHIPHMRPVTCHKLVRLSFGSAPSGCLPLADILFPYFRITSASPSVVFPIGMSCALSLTQFCTHTPEKQTTHTQSLCLRRDPSLGPAWITPQASRSSRAKISPCMTRYTSTSTSCSPLPRDHCLCFRTPVTI